MAKLPFKLLDKRAGRPLADLELKRLKRLIATMGGLLLLLTGSVLFLLNYTGFNTWQKVDGNLFVFLVVNVNIVLLTAVFYMLLRNLFRLFYERKAPVAAVGLKTKLILAFVALSIPSTAFHLMTGTFMAAQFDNWSKGEYKQVLDASQVVMRSLDAQEDQRLAAEARLLAQLLPGQEADYAGEGWRKGFELPNGGAVLIYAQDRRMISSWGYNRAMRRLYTRPSPQYFNPPEGFQWREWLRERLVRRMIIPIQRSQGGLWVEVALASDPSLGRALEKLDYKEDSARFLRKDLFLAALIILFVMATLIVFSATWMAFYLARGFVGPVEQLAEATRKVSGGELGWQVSLAGLGPLRNDFEGLVVSFNQMSGQLKDQHERLTEAAEHLRLSHQELGEHARFIELLLENMEVAILALDPDGRINTLNRAATGLLGLKKAKAEGKPFQTVLEPAMAGLVEEMVERLLAGQRGRGARNITLTQGGEARHLKVAVLPLKKEKGHHGLEGVVVMAEDVTDLQRTQRAEAWREVAKRVAHEIKNPLTPIQLSAQRIQRKYVGHLPNDEEVLVRCTETIINEVTSLKKMVNEFSQFAKLPDQKPRTDNLNQVVREVANLYQQGLPDHIALTLELDSSLPDFPLDREQMRRVFTNLIDNAQAAIPEGEQGLILVRTQYLAKSRRVKVEVVDNGEGVPEAVRPRLFEPYTSTKEGGTGLGLTISNQIVSDHRGYLRYAPNKPHGSVFSLELPVV